MKIVNCPNCKEPVKINISKAVDEEGEVYICSKCHKSFRYAPNG